MARNGETRKNESCILCAFCDKNQKFCFLIEKGMETPFELRRKENFSPASALPCDYFLTFEELEGIIIEHIFDNS